MEATCHKPDNFGRQTFPNHRNYYEDDADDDKSNINRDGLHNYGATASRSKTKATPEKLIISSDSSVRSRRKEKYSNSIYEKDMVPPSLTEQIRQSSSSRKPPSSNDSNVQESAVKCIENNFDPATIYSAKSIAYSLVNPCGISTTHVVDSNLGHPLPMTPSTVSSSSSDDSQASPGEYLDTCPSISSRRSSKSKSDNGQHAIPFLGSLENRRASPPARSANVNTEDGDMIVFVGNEQYRFPSSGSSVSFASKYFLRQRKQADNFFYVDLSPHSSEEFNIVMDFFEKNTAADTRGSIHWKNLPIFLPWFVEFQALPLMSAVDTFLLHNGLSASGDRGYRGDSGNRYRYVCLSSLLSLTQIAYACGLESTKSHARRLLRKGLLEPRKQTTNPELDSSRLSEVAEDIELEWTLQDLQVLAQIMQTHDDLREYLWEVAVIIYLPHDLDISDSIGLVSNNLFPFLLREGMMQMMIVEGIESTYQTNDSCFNTECSATSSSMSNSKALGSSFSEHTSCSDTTIPTTPSSQRNSLTEKKMQQYFKSIIKQLKKFKAEKEARDIMLEQPQHNSLVEDEVDEAEKTRPRRGYGASENRSATKASTSRGVTTFAC
jgi:hypothetical protein